MYKYKNIKNNLIFYSDTDSVFLKKKISKIFINSQLGFISNPIFNKKIIEAFFLSTKFYGLKLINNFNKNTKVLIKATGFTKNFLKFIDLKSQYLTLQNKHFFKSTFKNYKILKIIFIHNKKFTKSFSKRDKTYYTSF